MNAATMLPLVISHPGGPLSIPVGLGPIVGQEVAIQFWSPNTKLTDPYITVVEP